MSKCDTVTANPKDRHILHCLAYVQKLPYVIILPNRCHSVTLLHKSFYFQHLRCDTCLALPSHRCHRCHTSWRSLRQHDQAPSNSLLLIANTRTWRSPASRTRRVASSCASSGGPLASMSLP